jgi:hypothetical protein
MAEELPLGGNLNDAVRVGNTVRRRAGPWTPAVHTLLRFLEAEGFPARARLMQATQSPSPIRCSTKST